MIASSSFMPGPRRAATIPNSAMCPRTALIVPVRSATSRSRIRCSISNACWVSLLTGTNRMLGRWTASQQPSASAASCLLVLTYGFTYCAGMSRTSWPSSFSSRAQWCAPPHASIPITHGGRLAKNSSTWPRLSFFLSVGLPLAAMPWT